MKMNKSEIKREMLDKIVNTWSIVPYHDDSKREKLNKVLSDVKCIFGERSITCSAPLVLIFQYKQSEQNGERSKSDGVSIGATIGGERYTAIGISIEALERPDCGVYVPFVMIHELTHVFLNDERGHTLRFYRYFVKLLEEYFTKTR